MLRPLILALLALCACGGEIAGEDGTGDAGAVDAATDATATDASDDGSIRDVVLPDGFDAMSCIGELGFDTPCTPEIEAICETRARDQAYAAYGHSICQNGACTRGDYCPDGPDGSTPCRCSPTLICAPGYVCYSDTPDGSTHCKPVCTPSP